MASSALYNKYRPICFKNMFGEEHIVKSLTNAITKNQLGHAYIFHGPRGIGKTTAAKLFAKAINCLNFKDNDVCNKCRNCLLFNNNQTLDIIELDAASNNGVAEIRNIIDNVNYLPTDLKIKVFILDEAHMLTTGAWNALLKTLEDCPEHVMFIFATTEFHKIPLTILSRCQCFSFKPFSKENLFNLIRNISQLEKIKINDEAIKRIAILARGAARDAITLLEQVKTYAINSEITETTINDIFGLLDEAKKINFINALATQDLKQAINILNDFENDGINLNLLIHDLFAMFIDVYLYLKHQDSSLLKFISPQNINLIKINDFNQALKFAEIWEDLISKIHFSSNIKFNLELAIFRATKNDDDLIINNPSSSKELQTHTTKKVDPKKVVEMHQQTIIKKAELAKEESTNIPDDLSSDLNEVFKTEEIKIDLSPKQKYINDQDFKSETIEKLDDDAIKNAFFSIAKAYEKELVKSYSEIFKKMKTLEDVSNDISFLLKAKKVLLASETGLVLIYDSNDEVTFVNNHIFDSKFNQFIYEHFNKPLMVIAMTKEMVSKYNLEFEKLKSIPDLNIDRIKNIVHKKNQTKEFAQNLFGSDLKYE